MIKLLVSAAVALVLTTSSVLADVIYTYTGNDFTIANSPYTTTEKVTATVDLSNPLGDSVTDVTVTPVSFVLSDGQQSITQATALFSDFEFWTGPTGLITGWDVSAGTAVDAMGDAVDGIVTALIPATGGFVASDIGFLPTSRTEIVAIDPVCPGQTFVADGPAAGNVCDPGRVVLPRRPGA